MKFKSIFSVSFPDQEAAIKSLLKDSRETHDFYFLLGLASFISTLGFLIDNLVVLISGMLIAPLLYPVMSLSLGVVTSSRLSVKRSLKTIGKSIALVVGVSLIVTFLFKGDNIGSSYLLYMKTNLVWFLIAFAAGVGVTYTHVKKELSEVLPGVALALSLLTPLVTVGMAIALWNGGLLAESLTMFIVNILGIFLGGLTIFSLFGFAQLKSEEEKKIVDEVIEARIQETAKKEVAEIEEKELEKQVEVATS